MLAKKAKIQIFFSKTLPFFYIRCVFIVKEMLINAGKSSNQIP